MARRALKELAAIAEKRAAAAQRPANCGAFRLSLITKLMKNMNADLRSLGTRNGSSSAGIGSGLPGNAGRI